MHPHSPDAPLHLLERWDAKEVRQIGASLSQTVYNEHSPALVQGWTETGPVYSEDDQAREAADAAFIARFGSMEGAARFVGHAVALEAERRAGVTAAEIDEMGSRDQGALEEAERAARATQQEAEEAAAPLRGAVRSFIAGKTISEAVRAKREDPGYQEAVSRWEESEEKAALDAASAEVYRAVAARVGGAPSAETAAKVAALADAYQQTLSELRPFGEVDAQWGGGTPNIAAAATEVARSFPDDWVRAHNEHGKVYLENAYSDRAHYSPASPIADPDSEQGAARLCMRQQDAPGMEALAGKVDHFYQVGMHEFSHRAQDCVPGISRIEQEFLERRTTDPDTGEREELVALYGGTPGDPRVEAARADNFVSAYIGKEYDLGRYMSKFTEVLSMGSEALLAGAHGALVGAGRYPRDEDMRAVVLGIYATVGHPVRRRADYV